MLINDHYLRNLYNQIGKCPVWTTEQERELFAAYKKNPTTELKQKIVSGYYRYVMQCASKTTSEEYICDYFNQGVLGLMDAVDRYDVNNGNKFLAFAKHYIRMSMNTLKRKSELAPVPNNTFILRRQIEHIRDRFYMEHGTFPSDDEIRARMTGKFKKCEIDLALRSDTAFYSVDNEDTDFLLDSKASVNLFDSKASYEDKRKVVTALLKPLNEKQRYVITRSYLEGAGAESIADELHTTVSNVHSISTRSLSLMRKYAKRIGASPLIY